LTNLTQTIEAMSPAERKGALTALDYLTRPLTTQEIAGCLRKSGVSWSRAQNIAGAVAHMHIVAIVGE